MKQISRRDKSVAELLSTYLDLLHEGRALDPKQFLSERASADETLSGVLDLCQELWDKRHSFLELSPERSSRLYQQFLRTIEGEKEKSVLKQAIERGTAEILVEKRVDVLLLFLGLVREVWGSIRLFKLLFLVEKEGNIPPTISDYYTYDAYAFGPFTQQIYKDIEVLSKYQLLRKLKPVRRRRMPSGRLKQPEVDAVYVLTEKGTKFAQALLRSVRKTNPDFVKALIGVRDRYAHMQLRDLLQYIYKAYPEYATQSEIRDEILKYKKDIPE